MLRLRLTIPLLLSSLASAPALGEFNTSYCTASATSPRCEAERAREFAAARNAEIDASIAAVNAARAWLVLARTHCKTSDSTTPRCMAERTRKLALARTHCKTPGSTTPRCMAERARDFAAARNAEINASIAAVNAERARVLAQSMTNCKTANSTTPRCEAERAREFAAARNAEIDASIAAVGAERARAFAAARNAEINVSIAAVDAERSRAFAAAHNAEIDASIAAVDAERARAFAAARNAEINASIAASEAQRALRLALASARQTRVETGAISLPEAPSMVPTAPIVRRAHHAEPCREAARLMSPLEFSDGNAAIEQAMMPELDRIVMMARTCPAIRIEIHGHSDNSGPSQVNRHLAQRRAQAAADYLVQEGVDRNRLAAIGHADGQPLVPNTTADNRALNRRVEMVINDPALQAAAQRVMWDLAELLDPTYVPPLARLSP
jgi:outer membrane protein OmpA-like peptidoglycan-associated protein